jgi:hypothetical protein
MNDTRNYHWNKNNSLIRKDMDKETDKYLKEVEKYIKKDAPRFIRKELGFK